MERKRVRKDSSVGGKVLNPMRCPILNITVYASVLSDTLSLELDMPLLNDLINCVEQQFGESGVA